MISHFQEPHFWAGLFSNSESRSYDQVSTDTEGALPTRGPEVTSQDFLYDDTYDTFQEEKAMIMTSFNSSVMPVDINTPPAVLVDPSLVTPPGSSSSSSSLASIWGDPTPTWPGVYSVIPNEFEQDFVDYSAILHPQSSASYPVSGSPPGGLDTFDSSLASPPGLDAHATEAMDVKPGRYCLGSVPRSVPNRHRSTDQGTFDRRFTCTVDNCGKDFSGEWEKMRHIKSIHFPPTIGCRLCNYKQSRKDLFTEHCRKRHPGQSIENLMIQLITPSA